MERVISQAEDSVIHHTQVDGGEDSRGKADSRSGPVFTKHFILPLRILLSHTKSFFLNPIRKAAETNCY